MPEKTVKYLNSQEAKKKIITTIVKILSKLLGTP